MSLLSGGLFCVVLHCIMMCYDAICWCVALLCRVDLLCHVVLLCLVVLSVLRCVTLRNVMLR